MPPLRLLKAGKSDKAGRSDELENSFHFFLVFNYDEGQYHVRGGNKMKLIHGKPLYTGYIVFSFLPLYDFWRVKKKNNQKIEIIFYGYRSQQLAPEAYLFVTRYSKRYLRALTAS